MALNATNLSGNLSANLTNATASAAETIGSSANILLSFFTVGIPSIIFRFWDLIAAPFKHTHMQWIIIPLIATFVISEFYFFRHTEEELGWNAALMNSLVLVFVAIDLTKTVFDHASPWEVLKLFFGGLSTGEHLGSFLVIGFVGGLGLALVIINYFHMLPRKMAYTLSSHPPVNFIAYFAVVMVYSAKDGDPIPLNGYTVIAATLLFILVLAAVFWTQRKFGSLDYTRTVRA